MIPKSLDFFVKKVSGWVESADKGSVKGVVRQNLGDNSVNFLANRAFLSPASGAWALIYIFLTLLQYGCAGKQVEPLPPLPRVPDYVSVLHPLGYEIADVQAIFRSPSVPEAKVLEKCDSDLKKVRSKTESRHEVYLAARELVVAQPIQFHWCFYWKILELQSTLAREDSQWFNRQEKVLEAYFFLVPVAQAFRIEFDDSRYLRWAINHYAQTSERVFYRKVELLPQAVSSLLENVNNPYALWRKPKPSTPILEKYGIFIDGPRRSPAEVAGSDYLSSEELKEENPQAKALKNEEGETKEENFDDDDGIDDLLDSGPGSDAEAEAAAGDPGSPRSKAPISTYQPPN